MMLLLCYPKCSTCKKAQTWLDQQKVPYEYRDIKLDNPSYEELNQWHVKSGLPLRKFFNTSGQLYRSLNLKEKLSNMSEEEQLHLLASDGMLVKRPLVVLDDTVLLGFKQEFWEEILSAE